MKSDYIVEKHGGYYISDSRVSLDSVVYMYRKGARPEKIRDSFPVLTLEEVYGAIAFYLHNQVKIDKHLEESEVEFERQADERRAELKRTSPELYEKLKQRRVALR